MKNKRGQFYLIAAAIIIVIVLSYASISNTSKKQQFTEIESAKQELEIESRAVLDYAAYSGTDAEAQLTAFTQDYSSYSSAENLYFVFGDGSKVNVAAYQRAGSGTILVNVGSGDVEMEIEKDTYTKNSYSNPGPTITLTINEVSYDFELKQGTNFYFILLEAKQDGYFVFTGSAVREIHEN